MKRLVAILGALLFPVLTAHLLLAAGFFKVGEKAPSFALNAITGEAVSLDAYKGKVVVLWLFHICDPCMMQGSNLQKVYEATQGKNVAVIGVNSSGNSKTEVGEFIPNVYVIDQQGVIRWQRVGNMELAGADVIIAEVEKLLAGGSNKM